MRLSLLKYMYYHSIRRPPGDPIATPYAVARQQSRLKELMLKLYAYARVYDDWRDR